MGKLEDWFALKGLYHLYWILLREFKICLQRKREYPVQTYWDMLGLDVVYNEVSKQV